MRGGTAIVTCRERLLGKNYRRRDPPKCAVGEHFCESKVSPLGSTCVSATSSGRVPTTAGRCSTGMRANRQAVKRVTAIVSVHVKTWKGHGPSPGLWNRSPSLTCSGDSPGLEADEESFQQFQKVMRAAQNLGLGGNSIVIRAPFFTPEHDGEDDGPFGIGGNMTPVPVEQVDDDLDAGSDSDSDLEEELYVDPEEDEVCDAREAIGGLRTGHQLNCRVRACWEACCAPGGSQTRVC